MVLAPPVALGNIEGSVGLDQLPPAPGVYIIHCQYRYLGAGHYLGVAGSLAVRMHEHRYTQDGSPLLRRMVAVGNEWWLAAYIFSPSWSFEDAVKLEQWFKDMKATPRYCPWCRAGLEQQVLYQTALFRMSDARHCRAK